MASSTSKRLRGKQVDQTGQWSPTKWDEDRQVFYNDRIGPSGETEYHYHEEATTTTDRSVPRGNSGFGTRDTSVSTSDQNLLPYPSPGAGSAAFPPAWNSYTTAASWPNSTPAYSSAYPAQNLSFDPSSGNYGRNTPSSSTQYPSYGSSQYGPGPTSVYSGSANYSENNTYPISHDLDSYVPPESAQEGSQILETGFSSMTLGPSAEEDQLPVPKPIRREPHSRDYETLDARYRQIPEKEQNKFFRVGRVFMMLWTEPAGPQVPAGGGTLPNGSHISTTWLGQKAYSEIRRLVVIQEGYGNSICSPIQTYSGQATLKPNLPDRHQHAIIYTSKECPELHSYTANDGTVVREELSKDPIKVRSEQMGPEGDLGNLSRINYSKIYTVEHYVRVLNIGMVDRDSIPSLKANSMIYRGTPAEKPVKHPSRSESGHHRKSKGGKGKDKRR